MNPIPYGRQHITEADINAVADTLRSDYLTTGPRVAEFERKFADYVGASYSVAVSNGTAALHLCAMALNVEPGVRVITTPITFVASANCVRFCGGEVWFADIDPETLLLDINRVEELIEKYPPSHFHGIIPVDFAGYPIDMEAFRRLADRHGLWIIEDACHAPGGYFTDSNEDRQYCGNGRYADLAIFSFHPVKHIASGEGGMITTDNPALYHKLLALRAHGIVREPADLVEAQHGGWYMEMQMLGYNYRIPDILCALGISQLDRAETGMELRQLIAERYDQYLGELTGVKVHGTPMVSGTRHAFHLYIIEVDDRRGLYDYLRRHHVFAQVHYIPVHTMPYYRAMGYYDGVDLSIAENYYVVGLSLPMYPTLTKDEQDYVINCIRNFLLEGAAQEYE